MKNDNASKKYEDIHFVDSTKPVWNYSLFSDEDIKNFQKKGAVTSPDRSRPHGTDGISRAALIRARRHAQRRVLRRPPSCIQSKWAGTGTQTEIAAK